ncbi:hypothetical protein HPB51_020835 [Rhipicephalus microplus]|uniref:Uncharacterized protein n=1 Tax=Rhipicephalus microplus TaxID=6941 RepID=A0A9J6EBT4_RHIMP|nr:hypothetical protein HPB51_020835 [Rhipicephalus microplus]
MLGGCERLVGLEKLNKFEKELSTAELREEVSLTIERLQMRVKSVDVSVTTPRSEEQEAALAQIEQYVTNLVRRMTSDPKGASGTSLRRFLALDNPQRGYIDAVITLLHRRMYQKYRSHVQRHHLLRYRRNPLKANFRLALCTAQPQSD